MHYPSIHTSEKAQRHQAGIEEEAKVSHMLLPALFIVLFAVLLTFVPQVAAQNSDEEDRLWQMYNERMDERRSLEWILFGWGGLNVTTGAAMLTSEYRDFGLMNLAWGAINMAIVTPSLFFSDRPTPEQNSFGDTVREEMRFQRIVAINASLNVSYIMAGAGMLHYGDSSQIRQFGTSVIIQGGFLLLYDLVLLRYSSRYLNRITEKVSWEIQPELGTFIGEEQSTPSLTFRINL